MKYSLILAIFIMLIYGCNNTDISKVEIMTTPITKGTAIKIAEKVSRKATSFPDNLKPLVKETELYFIVTYPMTLLHGTRGGDYYTKVTIEKKSGKLMKFEVSP